MQTFIRDCVSLCTIRKHFCILSANSKHLTSNGRKKLDCNCKSTQLVYAKTIPVVDKIHTSSTRYGHNGELNFIGCFDAEGGGFNKD